MKHGFYIGDNPEIENQRALLRESGNRDTLLAQFDNLNVAKKYTHGWIELPAIDFIFEDEIDDYPGSQRPL